MLFCEARVSEWRVKRLKSPKYKCSGACNVTNREQGVVLHPGTLTGAPPFPSRPFSREIAWYTCQSNLSPSDRKYVMKECWCFPCGVFRMFVWPTLKCMGSLLGSVEWWRKAVISQIVPAHPEAAVSSHLRHASYTVSVILAHPLRLSALGDLL